MEQLPHEIDIFGPYIFREDNSTIEQLSEQQQENRQYFAELCQERRLVVMNTMFQKDSARLITYKNTTTPNFQTPYMTDRYAQMDDICINQPWKNSVTHAETTLQHSITSDHKLLVSSLTTKLARKGKKIRDNPQMYRPPSNEQLLEYNQLVSASYEDQQVSANEDPFEVWASILQDAAAKSFTPVPANQRKPYISDDTWKLLCDKQDKTQRGLTHEANEAEKTLRNHLRQDKRKHMIEQLEAMDEQGHKWKGIKYLRKKFEPKHCKFKDGSGNYIPESRFPTKAAEYLAEVQWKAPEGNYASRTQTLSHVGENIKDTDWSLNELNEVIKNLKRNKTPGPDKTAAELLKWLNDDNRAKLLTHYNDILVGGKYFRSLNYANIASIYKKGDPAKLGNYRPIALLQTFYKVLAALIKLRIADVIDPWISKTQFGFRKKKSTAQAIFIARRLMDMAERQGTNMSLIFLDWQKAFDKVDQHRLIEVLQRLHVPSNILQTISNMYKEAQFRVVKGENKSEYKAQKSGIRQGCPLYPYLFCVLLSAIFQDIKCELNTPKQKEPIQGLQYAEVMYADDTLVFGTHTHTINKLLHLIQAESQKYNLRLNLEKCVNLTINQHQSSVKFLDGSYVPRKEQTAYLGATLTVAVDNRREVLKKIGEATGIANQLKLLWSKARTTKTWKLRVLTSAVFNKLSYGLETIQLTKAEQSRIDTFQMKMLRRVLQVPPTHVDREWTNLKVIRTLAETSKYKHVRLSEAWRRRKITLLGHILRSPPADPMRQVLFEQGTYAPRIEFIRRVGKPRAARSIRDMQRSLYISGSPH